MSGYLSPSTEENRGCTHDYVSPIRLEISATHAALAAKSMEAAMSLVIKDRSVDG